MNLPRRIAAEAFGMANVRASVTAGLANDVGCGEPVSPGNVQPHGHRDGLRASSGATPDDRQQPEGGHDLAEHLSAAGARVP